MKLTVKNPQEVAKEAFWLAWQACGGPLGMGWLQNNPNANKEAVWQNVSEEGDYQGRFNNDANKPYADYVFGRMMKVGFTIGSDFVEFREETPHPDYQAWCRKYPTYQALVEAAIKNTN